MPYLRAERSRLYPEREFIPSTLSESQPNNCHTTPRGFRMAHGFPPFIHRGVGPARERAQRQRAAWEPPFTNIDCKTPDEG